jgi:hypothetical protein
MRANCNSSLRRTEILVSWANESALCFHTNWSWSIRLPVHHEQSVSPACLPACLPANQRAPCLQKCHGMCCFSTADSTVTSLETFRCLLQKATISCLEWIPNPPLLVLIFQDCHKIAFQFDSPPSLSSLIPGGDTPPPASISEPNNLTCIIQDNSASLLVEVFQPLQNKHKPRPSETKYHHRLNKSYLNNSILFNIMKYIMTETWYDHYPRAKFPSTWCK